MNQKDISKKRSSMIDEKLKQNILALQILDINYKDRSSWILIDENHHDSIRLSKKTGQFIVFSKADKPVASIYEVAALVKGFGEKTVDQMLENASDKEVDLSKVSAYDPSEKFDVVDLKLKDNFNSDYLVKTRNLNPKIVNDFKDAGLLATNRKGQTMFLWKNKDGEFTGADVKSDKYKGISKNSKGAFIFETGAVTDKVEVIIAESPIDLISYYQLNGHNHPNAIYVSSSGVNRAKQAFDYAIADRRDKRNVQQIVLAFDRDDVGQQAAKDFKEKLPEAAHDRTIIVHPAVKTDKDWNEALQSGHNYILKMDINWGNTERFAGLGNQSMNPINKVEAKVDKQRSM